MSRRALPLLFRATLAAACALAFGGVVASAEGSTEACPFTLGQALELHDAALNRLLARRGLEGETTGGAPAGGNFDDVASQAALEGIRAYLSHPQGPGVSDANALLVYVADADSVCLVHARGKSGGPPAEVTMLRLPVAPDQLRGTIEARLNELVGPSDRPERAPVRRNAIRPESPAAEPEPQTRGAVSLQRRVERRPSEAILADISALLIPPEIARTLEDGTVSLTVVPILNIATVPIAALDPDGDGTPLIETMVITVEASFRAVVDDTVYGWQPGFRHPVVLGDPDATHDAEWILPRLPGAEKEALRVADLLGTRPWIALDATKARLETELPQADYIHIAAHGIADPEDPMGGSFIALTDGRLTAREIQSFDVRDNLPVVSLSACQSALGGTLEAGIIGVARGFLYAGAIDVIASLWNVDDGATSEIMTAFAANLLKTNPPNALRLAQIEARRTWPDPRIWAAFIVFGSRVVDAG